MTLNFIVNGKPVTLETEPDRRLLDILREDLHLTGTKEGCAEGECGACTVLVDNTPVDSCIFLAVWADGKTIRTAEGEAKGNRLSRVQQAYVDAGAVQCGFCTPGFIMTAVEILESGKLYTDAELRKLLSGHLCRCTGYENILRAVKKTMYRRLGLPMPAEPEA